MDDEKQRQVGEIVSMLDGNQSGTSYVNLTNPAGSVYLPDGMEETADGPRVKAKKDTPKNKMRGSNADSKEKP